MAAPLNIQMKGDMKREKTINGRATARAVFSGLASAIDFGASSPRTMWKKVSRKNANGTAATWVAVSEGLSPIVRKSWSNRWASTGSPIQPSASDAMVIPNCVPAM